MKIINWKIWSKAYIEWNTKNKLVWGTDRQWKVIIIEKPVARAF